MKPIYESFRPYGLFLMLVLSMGVLNVQGQDAGKLSPVELANRLFAAPMLAQVQLHGRFEFFSAYDEGALEPSSSADFVGEINLASRRTHFDFQNYKSPVYQSKEPALHVSYSVTFDGEKWVVVDSGSRIDALPQKLAATAEITTERPRLFLKSLDQLCFPLFPSLLNVQVGLGDVAPLQKVLNGEVEKTYVTTDIKSDSLVLTVRNGSVTDELTFDPAKGYALTHRRTDFGPKTSPNDNSIVNELTITELIQADNLWLPKVAEFTQTVNGKVTVKRDYKIEVASVVKDAKPIEAAIPPNTYVRDERTGENYRTKSDVK